MVNSKRGKDKTVLSQRWMVVVNVVAFAVKVLEITLLKADTL